MYIKIIERFAMATNHQGTNHQGTTLICPNSEGGISVTLNIGIIQNFISLDIGSIK